jgi:polyhydroxyalkanoate synthesis regulator phasin
MTTRDAGKAMKEFAAAQQVSSTATQGLIAGLKGLAVAGGIAIGVGLAIKKGIDATAGATLNYAKQVRNLTIEIGAAPEEASKLIQVADDMGIEFGQLETALEGAIRKGVKPTISGIAELSDQYLKLAPGVERTKFLFDNFGRSGADLARLMELGSTQIKTMGDSIEGTARLMDGKALVAAEQYRIALDDMGDAAEDAKLSLGRGLIPALSQFTKLTANLFQLRSGNLADDYRNIFKALTDFKRGWSDMDLNASAIASGMGIKETGALANAIKSADAAKQAQTMTDEQAAAQEAATKRTQEHTAAMREQGIEGGLGKSQMETYNASVYAMAEAEKTAAQAAQNAGDAFFYANLKTQDWIDTLGTDISGKISGWMNTIDYELAGGGKLDAVAEKIHTAILKGAIQPDEAKKFLAPLFVQSQLLQVELGNINAQQAQKNISEQLNIPLQEAKKLIEEVKAAGQFDLQSTITVYMDLVTRANSGTGYVTADQANQIKKLIPELPGVNNKRAVGGPVMAGSPYLVGERGPELFVPRQNGNIIPNGASGGDTYVTNENHFHSAGAVALGMAIVATGRRSRLDASMGM